MGSFKLTKPVKLIELFSGIGAQLMALKRLGITDEAWKTSDWDVNAVKSYKAIHHPNDNTDYSAEFNKEQLVDELVKLCISSDGKEPMTREKIERKGEKWLRETYNNFKASHNLGSITEIHAEDLEINDSNYETILTYSFPCFVGNTLVLTHQGYKEIKDVQCGDYVLTHNNDYQRVIKSSCTGRKKIFNINAMGVDEIRCTENHKFYVREMHRKWPYLQDGKRKNVRVFDEPKWVECNKLNKKYYLGVAINQKSEMPDIDNFLIYNHSFWYLVGRYVGDGWISKEKTCICGNEKKVQEIITHIKNCGFKYNINTDRTCLKVFIKSDLLNSVCKEFGCGAINKRIPGYFFDMPSEYIESFICGYFGSDGCFTLGQYKFTSISRELIYGVGQLIAKVYKMPYRIYKTKVPNTCVIEGRIVNQHDWYELRFKKDKRKQDKAFYEDGYIWFPINKIQEEDIEEVYDLTVEKDHSFTANGVIVHNCQDLSVAGKQKGMDQDSNTRSAMLWQVGRILDECKELGCLPDCLIMENVNAIHNKKNIENFEKWLSVLEELGYKSYWQDLNSKDYGIAQNRCRTFCVSVLSDKPYVFPEAIVLKTRLKDYLEPKVDEKYYINTEKAQKLIDDLIKRGVIGTNKRDRESESTSQLTIQKDDSLQTALSQDMMQESQTPDRMEPVLLSKQATKFEKFVDVSETMLARNYKGFGNQEMTGVLHINE